MFENIVPIFCGILAGIITGLIPGIHINLVSTLLLLVSGMLLNYFSIEQLIIFIISMGVIHSFLDFIPSIIFGIPSSETAMSILPAHKLVIEGKGKQALFLSASGSLLGAIFSLPLLLLLYFILPVIIPPITPFIPYALFGVVILFLLQEKNKNKCVWSLLFVLFATLYGLLLLNSYHLREPLLVIFTGLFGISSLLYSLKESSGGIPKQLPLEKDLPKKTFSSIFIGNCCAALCSTLPGLGNAQATTLMSLFFKDLTSKLFLVVTSSLNTTSFLVSIVTLSVLEKARNGAIVVVSQLTQNLTTTFLIKLLIISCLICVIGYFLTLIIGNKSLNFLSKVDEKKMNLGLLILLFFIIFVTESWYGILCLLGITSLGFFGLILEIRRVHFMSILLMPVAFFLI